MKCPVCQAKLLPVAGEMFCLQCGEAQHVPDSDGEKIELATTTDPLLQRAILDATDGKVNFVSSVPVPVAPQAESPKSGHTFGSLRSILTGPSPVLATPNGASAPKAASSVVESNQVSVAVSTPVTAAQKSVVSSAVAVSPADAVRPDPATSTEANVVVRPAKRSWLFSATIVAWAAGFAGLVIFVALNVVASNYYAQRVYPGVHVGSVAVGGVPFDALETTLAQKIAAPKLEAVINGQRYPLNTIGVGKIDLNELKNRTQLAGRAPILPLVAVIESWFSKPIEVKYAVNDTAVSRLVADLSARINHPSASAIAMVLGANVVVVSERTGAQIDEATAMRAIKQAYGTASAVSLSPATLSPGRVASDYDAQISAAQTVMGLSLAVTARKVRYAPTSEQIGQWIAFSPTDKGIVVDGVGVARYVRSLPGSFDKLATYNAFMAGLNARQPVAYAAGTKATQPPSVASAAVTLPLASYRYCATDTSLKTQLTQTLAAPSGWMLGGRLQYAAVSANCNMSYVLADITAMKALDPACEKQTTCRVHNTLAIATSSWAAVPIGWSGDLVSYRNELINHVTGQWLGFTHPGCSQLTTQSAVLGTPAVMIPGCSAQWYAVPTELQDTKILAGF